MKAWKTFATVTSAVLEDGTVVVCLGKSSHTYKDYVHGAQIWVTRSSNRWIATEAPCWDSHREEALKNKPRHMEIEISDYEPAEKKRAEYEEEIRAAELKASKQEPKKEVKNEIPKFPDTLFHPTVRRAVKCRCLYTHNLSKADVQRLKAGERLEVTCPGCQKTGPVLTVEEVKVVLLEMNNFGLTW